MLNLEFFIFVKTLSDMNQISPEIHIRFLLSIRNASAVYFSAVNTFYSWQSLLIMSNANKAKPIRSLQIIADKQQLCSVYDSNSLRVSKQFVGLKHIALISTG